MVKKSRRSSSRKMKHTRKHKTHRRRTHRRRGGADALEGAPVSYHLSGSWPSRMSLGQGADYFKYHVGQHGGAALGMGPYPGAVMDPGLPGPLRAAAHIGGIDKAIMDVRGLRDPPYDNMMPKATTGGRRRKHKKTHSKKSSRKHSRKHRRTHRRRRGGALGYAPFPSSGMLLSSPKAYAQAGLNPEWKTDVAFDLAKVRETQ
jgi:hypothetical protein